MSYHVVVPAGGEKTIWFGVAGAQAASGSAAGAAQATLKDLLADPEGALKAKTAARDALAARTKLDLPGDPQLAEGIDWSKQNLADAVQETSGLQIRETNAGTRYPPPVGTVDHARWIAPASRTTRGCSRPTASTRRSRPSRSASSTRSRTTSAACAT